MGGNNADREINGQIPSPPHHEEQMEDRPARYPDPQYPNIHIPMLGPIPRTILLKTYS